ncbi:hypothetical protein [Enterobacter hormaechei]|jgi:hypothetical protein|uniref:hypothetical protein n=1 Tax=Enterobacter hormaechei TaxID=158836 RepID=UPI002044E379|nr:hypothetical protein [Enterobacter hormaechei]
MKNNHANIIIIIYALVICILTSNVFMINTSDFYRSVFPFIGEINTFDGNLTLNYELKKHFLSVFSYDYISSYSYILYIYAYIISLFTNYLDLRLLSCILKVIFIITLYALFKAITKQNSIKYLVIFFIITLPILSTSNLAFFSSFYQEQIVILTLPIIALHVTRSNKKDIIITFVAATLIACSKSQFFYTPLIVAIAYSIFNRDNLKLKALLTLISMSLSVLCISGSTGAAAFNKYHATYFGVYEYATINNLELDQNIDRKCIGIDAWGNKFNLESGAVQTEIGGVCFGRNVASGFGDVISWVVKNPSIIYNLPFDAGIKTQYTENYFHVFNGIKLIQGNTGVMSYLTETKDYLFKNIRFLALFIAMLLAIICLRKQHSISVFTICSFGASQLYVAFFGEGYRDLDKHLFGMNFAFDLSIFIAISLLIRLKLKD